MDNPNLNFYREQIDSQIIRLLSQRNNLSKQVKQYKKENNLQIFNAEREQEIFEKLKQEAKILNIDSEYLKKVFELIILNSHKLQED